MKSRLLIISIGYWGKKIPKTNRCADGEKLSQRLERKGAVTRLLWGISTDSSSLVRHQFSAVLHSADSLPCHVKGGHMGFKEDRITVSLYCVTLGATAAVCLHAHSLESFVLCAAAAANRSITKQNHLVLYQVMNSFLIPVSDLLMQLRFLLGIRELILIFCWRWEGCGWWA